MRKAIPWWLKLAVKILISFFNVPYSIFRNLSLFKHGDMIDHSHAIRVLTNHLKLIDLKKEDLKGKVILEIGAGDSLSMGVICGALGAKKTILVDAGDYAIKDISVYNDLLKSIYEANLVSTIFKFQSIDDLLSDFNITYYTTGTESLKNISDNSVDLVFSHVCLEHVLKNEMNLLVKQLKRVSVKNSVQSHIIDFKDHLAYSLNNMRFSDKFWESNVLQSCSAYTNRLRLSDYLELFQGQGFRVDVVGKNEWAKLPILESSIHKSYQYGLNDLLVKEAELVVYNDNNERNI